MRAAALLLAAWTGFGVLACVSPTDPLGREDALKETQKRYTEAIRWGDLEKASRFVDPELREAFLALMDSFESIRITDYEIGDLVVEEDGRLHAEVDVTYRGYVLPHYVERRVNDHQVWFREEGMGNRWLVRPELALLIDALSTGAASSHPPSGAR